jgi:hypothetical protein
MEELIDILPFIFTHRGIVFNRLDIHIQEKAVCVDRHQITQCSTFLWIFNNVKMIIMILGKTNPLGELSHLCPPHLRL